VSFLSQHLGVVWGAFRQGVESLHSLEVPLLAAFSKKAERITLLSLFEVKK
jgi:hypothetical protein